jgi:hypothetical protein
MVRLVHYPSECHPKNKESMIRMCKTAGIEYEATNDRGRLNHGDYDYLWLPMFWISPDEIPLHVKILYGPQFFVFPEGALVGPRRPEWSKRAVYNVLADWNLDVFKEFASETVIPLVSHPFGINPAIEDVRLMLKPLDCIVYFKDRDPKQLEYAEGILNAMKYSYRVFRYGSYSNDDYMKTLATAKFALWIGRHESQGFAFQECLASNVPILVWDTTSMFDEWGAYKEYKGKKNLYATAASQWSSACGERIIRDYELPKALRNIMSNLQNYRPREFILNNVGDKVAMNQILQCLNDK